MKKGCLIAIFGVVGLFVLLTIIGVVASLFGPKSEGIAEAKRADVATVPAKENNAKNGDSEPTESKPAKESFKEFYSIISNKPHIGSLYGRGFYKRSVNVRLNEKVKEETLERIATEIRDSDPMVYDRTFIVYYLPGGMVGMGGWATSHFTPNLKVNVLGLRADSEAATSAKEGETEIGRWEYQAPPGFVAVVLKSENGVIFRRFYNDGSSGDEEMTVSQKAGKIVIKPVEENDFGEHWILDSDGSLQLMDKDGLIGKAVISGEKKNAGQFDEVLGFGDKPKGKVITIFDPRTWTSADGQRSFVGKLRELEDGELTLMKDGEPLTFATAKLSAADREFLGQGITITSLDGKVHENGSVARVSADSILFKKASGPVTIAMANLPEELRQRFGYGKRIAAEKRKSKEAEIATPKAAETNLSNSARKPGSSTQWYKGGNLHKATVTEWENATPQNRLATTADWLSTTKWKGHLNSPADFQKLKEKSQLLVDALAEASSGNSLDSLTVSELAASLLLISSDFGP